ncbi:biopolymer transporter ExbD [Opitutales bacterium]|nr:biopolymer transporter ExbD [Opitutales bacterium]
MTTSNKRRTRKPKIDVVPLIDVLMVLIIFFLVTMQFQDLRALNVKLPKIESAGSNLIQNELIISIKEKGETFVNGNETTLPDLKKILKSSSQLQKKPLVLVVADENVPLKHVTEVVDLCRLNNLEDFRLQSR